MFRLIGLFIKLTLFSIFVLVLGNWLHFGGKTISDQIKIGMSHAEETGIIDGFRSWTKRISSDAKRGFQKKLNNISIHEEIPSNEKQKLKALIRDLNSSHKNE